ETDRGDVVVGLMEDGRLVGQFGAATLAELLQLDAAALRAAVDRARTTNVNVGGVARVLAPVDGETEVWAAGVTYKRSEEARREESDTPDIYSRVYRAERPEFFFKAN